MSYEEMKLVFVNMAVTFVEAGVAVWAASGFALDKAVVGAAVGSGLSAVWNIVLKPWLAKRGYLSKRQ